uniref:Ig-like domain-containing protein n=1 Tax=Knipowitschia caucasica TaxID=637954 RepID=A0AAV2KVB1_KNICA
MYFLRQLRKVKLPAQMLVQFYTAIIKSILTSSITVWFAGATVRDKQRLQCIVRSAEKVIDRSLPSLQDLCYLVDGISKGAWLNRSSIIFAGNDKWSVDPRVSIVSSPGDKHEYSLQIQKVDVSDDGQYTCSVQSERSPRPKLLNLIVKGLCH